MSFTCRDSKSFAEFSINTIWGQKALNGYCLIIPVEIKPHSVPEGRRPSLRDLSAALYLKSRNGEFLVGHLSSVNGRSVYEAYQHSHHDRHEFGIKINQRDIDQIEFQRNGGDINFEVKIKGAIYESDIHYQSGYEHRDIFVEQSKWIKILSDIGYSKIFTVEVHTTGDNSNPDYEHSYNKLNEAQQAYTRADWRQAVALCRDCLESLPIHQIDDVKPSHENTKAERWKLIHKKMLHLTHLAKHFNTENSRTANWEREDALYMIASCGALINKLAKTPE